MLMKKKVQRLIKSLLHYEPERAYLFGSWAKGKEDELSDLDAVVIKQTDSPFLDRLKEAACLLPVDLGGEDIPLSRKISGKLQILENSNLSTTDNIGQKPIWFMDLASPAQKHCQDRYDPYQAATPDLRGFRGCCY